MSDPIQHLQRLMRRSQIRPTLETLPSEIRRQLLSRLDPASLRALIHASPIYYQQFRLDRRFVLRGCLEVTLRRVAVDAHAVHLSSSRDFLRTRTPESVARFLISYRDRRYSTSSVLRELDVEDLTSMLRFHVSVVAPSISQYTRCALDHLAAETDIPRTSDPELSQIEQTRLLRALYRFQLCCNLFGVGHWGHYFAKRPEYMNEYILQSLITIFEPWEIEEISCVHLLAQDRYNQVFDEICADFDEDHPRFDGRFTPDQAVDLSEHPVERTYLLKGTISRGLELLHLVSTIDDHDALVALMDDHMVSLHTFIGDGVMEALSDATQRRLWRREPQSSRIVQVQQRTPMLFSGDVDNAPSLGWVLLWRETYSNMFGGCTGQPLRRWGYVMWDEGRMEQTGAKKRLIEWRDEKWKSEDPRDWEGLR